MAHKVKMDVPTIEMGKADAVFSVKQDGETLGALHISRGAIVWFPAGNTFGYKLSWKKFAEIMVDNGTRPSEKR
ncbi:MAG: hypothetical protein M0Q01_11455 [Syntrophales bacterium]|jgi:hypothetical protein|nr:hypothetical protein [Syntrophales bacterium]